MRLTSYEDILKIGGGDMNDVKRMIPYVQKLWDSGELNKDADEDF